MSLEYDLSNLNRAAAVQAHVDIMDEMRSEGSFGLIDDLNTNNAALYDIAVAVEARHIEEGMAPQLAELMRLGALEFAVALKRASQKQ